MCKNPLISVIIPVYNRELLIADTLESLLFIDYDNWESIIVDDGSTDKTIEVIKIYVQKENRIKFFRREREPKGAPTCRNIGLEKSQGDYVIFLDSDDIIAPHCIKQRAKIMNEIPNLDYAIFPMIVFKDTIFDTMKLWNVETEESEIVRILKLDSISGSPGVFWKKSSLEKIGAWNESLAMWQDVEILIRAFAYNLKYKIFFKLIPDVYVRTTTKDSISRKNYYKKEKIESRSRVFMIALNYINKLNIQPEELKYIAWAVITGYINRREFKLAKFYIKLAISNSILNKNVLVKFKKVQTILIFRLYKIPFYRTFYLKILGEISNENLMEKVNYVPSV